MNIQRLQKHVIICVPRWRTDILLNETYEFPKSLGSWVTKRLRRLLMPSVDGQEELLALHGSGNDTRECLPACQLAVCADFRMAI